jgi:hypothetical protein
VTCSSSQTMSFSSRLSLFILAFSLFALTSAQFQFFNGMFGHPQQQQQPSSGQQQWAMHADSRTCRRHPCRVDISSSSLVNTLLFILFITVSCSEYLCQDTLVCVNNPIDCPCPNVQDIKCVVPDAQDGGGTRLCIRGGTDCAQVEKLAKKFSQ